MSSKRERADTIMQTLIESLEQRTMLAGNVSAIITAAGDLVINGDGQDNDFMVEIGESGDVQITGENGTAIDDSGTEDAVFGGDITINLKGGDDQVRVTQEGSGTTIDNIRIDGRGGNDLIELEAMTGITGDVRLNGQSGGDALLVYAVDAAEDIILTGGSAGDTMQVYDTEARDITIVGGSGGDLAHIYAVEGDSLSTNLAAGEDEVAFYYGTFQELNVRTGAERDFLEFAEMAVAGDASINAGSGDNHLRFELSQMGNVSIRAGAGGGSDDFRVEESFASGDVSLNVGSGYNVLNVDALEVAGDLTLNSGGEDDEIDVNLTNVKYGELTLNSGGGDDEIRILESAAGELSVNTGGGHDTFGMKYTYAATTNINAGGGDDSVRIAESTLGALDGVMGSGDDFLQLNSVSANGVVNGGAGLDDLETFDASELEIEIVDF